MNVNICNLLVHKTIRLILKKMEMHFNVSCRAVQLIEFDSHAHLVSKAGSVIGSKSPSPVFKRSGS